MSESRTVMFEPAFPFPSILFTEVGFVIRELPPAMHRMRCMLFDSLPQVGREPYVHGGCLRTFEHINIEHISTVLAPERAGLRHIVCIRLQVLFHSPNRGSFHLSLAVLVHYRLPGSI